MISTLPFPRALFSCRLRTLAVVAAVGATLGCRDKPAQKSGSALAATTAVDTSRLNRQPTAAVGMPALPPAAERNAAPAMSPPKGAEALVNTVRPPADGTTDADDDEPAVRPTPSRKRGEPPDTSPRSPVEVVVRRGESMGLFARWAKLPMKALYARTDLEWGETLDVGRPLSFLLTDNEKARLQAGRATMPTPVEPEPTPVATRTAAPSAPAEPAVPTVTTTLRVRRGDSGWRIARRRGTSVRVLELLNPGRDLSRLQIGDEVKVPAGGGES